MSQRCARGLAAIIGLILAAFLGTGCAQTEQPPLALTGRIVFGFADLTEGKKTEGGPATTFETDLSGYWRDPRILIFDFRPTVTVGSAVPGTEMGNALTGFSAAATFLQGSSFPLTLTYSRSGSSFDETRTGSFVNPGLLTGVQIGSTNSVFDVGWLLRFRRLPVVHLNYRDTNNSVDLPSEFGIGDSHNLRDFTAHVDYNSGPWQAGAWYQRSQATVTFPNILSGGAQHDYNNTDDMGFSASRFLPLHSTLGVSADRTTSKFNFDNLETDTTVRNANITLTSQPVQRISTTLQGQYTSNLQAFQEQQALTGAGLPAGSGTGNPVPAGSVPFGFLAAPFHMLSLSFGTGIQLGHGFSLFGSAGVSHSSNEGRSARWSAGPAYQRKWRSGSLAASYSHTHTNTRAEVVSDNLVAGSTSSSQSTVPFNFFSQIIEADTAALNLNQNLPGQFRLATSAHATTGTLKENGIPLPDHEYGGLASLTRPVGEWTLTGSVNVEKGDANHELIYNRSIATGVAFGVAYRGLTVSAGRQYGSGLALQVGDRLLFVNNPVVVSPVFGVPILSSSRGTTVNGSYRSRRSRLEVTGNYGHFSFTTDQVPLTEYTLVNFRASYKLRRIRLIAGYTNQSQLFSAGPLSTFRTRLVYFQIERVFRVF